MTLAFSTHWPDGSRTYFPEKILMSETVQDSDCIKLATCLEEVEYPFEWDTPFNEKLHTLREDPHDRWKPGMKIHFVIWNRTPRRFQFAEGVCKSTQIVTIDYEGLTTTELFIPIITIDGRKLKIQEKEQLALNDGFDSLYDFLKYFDKSCTLKLIHWTDKKY